MLLAEEMFVFCHDAAGQPRCRTDALKAAVSASVFIELAILGRVSVPNLRGTPTTWALNVTDGAGTGDELLDRFHTEIRQHVNTQPFMAMHLLRDTIWGEVTQRLSRWNVLSSTEPVVFVPTYHWSGEVTAHMSRARSTLDAVLLDGVPPSDRVTAVIDILRTVKVLETMMAPPDRATKKTIRKNAKASVQGRTAQAAMARSLDGAIIAAKLNMEPEGLPPG